MLPTYWFFSWWRPGQVLPWGGGGLGACGLSFLLRVLIFRGPTTFPDKFGCAEDTFVHVGGFTGDTRTTRWLGSSKFAHRLHELLGARGLGRYKHSVTRSTTLTGLTKVVGGSGKGKVYNIHHRKLTIFVGRLVNVTIIYHCRRGTTRFLGDLDGQARTYVGHFGDLSYHEGGSDITGRVTVYGVGSGYVMFATSCDHVGLFKGLKDTRFKRGIGYKGFQEVGGGSILAQVLLFLATIRRRNCVYVFLDFNGTGLDFTREKGVLTRDIFGHFKERDGLGVQRKFVVLDRTGVGRLRVTIFPFGTYRVKVGGNTHSFSYAVKTRVRRGGTITLQGDALYTTSGN